jgi:hypothetical protein
VLSKPIQTNAAGVNVIVPAVKGKVIRVFGFSLGGGGLDATDAVSVQWQSSTGPTNLTGFRQMILGSPWDAPMTPMRVSSRDALFETAAGDALQLNVVGGTDVGGWVNYEIVPV